MTRRTLVVALAVTAQAALVAAWLTGCGNETQGGSEAGQTAPAGAADQPGAVQSDDELTVEEQQTLKRQFSAQAEQQITSENAETVAEQLEREIEADLAAE
jgi:hypothetical protein